MSEEIPEAPEVEAGETPEVAETAEVETSEEVVEEAATSEDAEPEKPKRRSRAEERINALTREKYEAQKQAEAMQRQLAEMQQYIQQNQQPQAPQDMPRLADFDYDEGRYQSAMTQWHQQQQQSWQQEQQRQQQLAMQQQEQMRVAQALQAKVADGVAKYPDFQQKVFDPSLPPLREINPAAFQAVMESDAAADVAYYLASNPQEVYAFASMNPVQAIRAVAGIEGKLAAKPAPQKAPPAPPSRVSGNSEAVKDPKRMTTDEWMKWRNAQLQSKR